MGGIHRPSLEMVCIASSQMLWDITQTHVAEWLTGGKTVELGDNMSMFVPINLLCKRQGPTVQYRGARQDKVLWEAK